jgi:hypothetical protein
VLAAEANMQLLVELLDPRGGGSGAAAAAAGGALSALQLGGEQLADQQQQQQRQQAAFHADLAPLLLLVLAAVVDARPGLLRERSALLRPAVAACLAAVGDPGLKRRWARLLASN